MFTAALFTIERTGKQPKCSSTKERIKMRYIYITVYYLTIKRNKTMPFAEMWMDLEIDIHSEVSQQ